MQEFVGIAVDTIFSALYKHMFEYYLYDNPPVINCLNQTFKLETWLLLLKRSNFHAILSELNTENSSKANRA